MPYHQSKDLLFFHVPKNAGTAITVSLDFGNKGHHFPKYYVKNKKRWKKCKKFAVVRNPFDRLVSSYEYAMMEKSYWHSKNKSPHPDYNLLKGKPFKECVYILKNNRKALRHQCWYPQFYYTSINGRDVTDFILRYENLNYDFKKWFPKEKLQVINVSKKKNFKKYYTPELVKIVNVIYSRDLKMYNYGWNK